MRDADSVIPVGGLQQFCAAAGEGTIDVLIGVKRLDMYVLASGRRVGDMETDRFWLIGHW